MGYKCINCGTTKKDNDYVFFIELKNVIYGPCCNLDCIQKIRHAEIERLKLERKELEETDIKVEVW